MNSPESDVRDRFTPIGNTMKMHFKSLVIASVLAGAGLSAFAQAQDGAPKMDGGPGMEHHHAMDPAKMAEMQAKHLAALKAKLQITAAEEPAWTAFTSSMKPPMHDKSKMMDMAELQKLPTPERLDKMRSMRMDRMNAMNADMDARDQAIKTFYAALTPEQQKVFDAEAMHRPGHGPRGAPKN